MYIYIYIYIISLVDRKVQFSPPQVKWARFDPVNRLSGGDSKEEEASGESKEAESVSKNDLDEQNTAEALMKAEKKEMILQKIEKQKIVKMIETHKRLHKMLQNPKITPPMKERLQTQFTSLSKQIESALKQVAVFHMRMYTTA